MPFINPDKHGKPGIIKNIAFCHLLNGVIPDRSEKITKIIKQLDEGVQNRADVTSNALSNAHGDWYEWLLGIEGWNYCAENDDAHVPLMLPNISRFDVASLYDEKLYNFIVDLRKKVADASKVQLITSNPDFVIVSRRAFDRCFGNIEPIDILTTEKIDHINEAYKNLAYKCGFEEIEGFISIKTSLRPDRRLQLSHEGSLMKAIYTHLQTREWILKPKGLKYYGVSTKVSKADRTGLMTVATHSITNVASLPQAAVDEVFEVNTLQQAEQMFSQILHSEPNQVES